MKRRLMLLTAAVLLMVLASDVRAHERFRFVGTVTKKTDKEMAIKTKDKIVEMDLDEKTVFLRDKTKIPRSAVKVGSSVVVDAIGDDLFDLVAEQVRLVPALAETQGKTTAPKK
jgi:hypothetical protein